MGEVPLSLPWRLISIFGITFSAGSILILFICLFLRIRKGLNPFRCITIYNGYIVPHPLHTFLLGVTWVFFLTIWCHVRLYQYSETGDGRGLNLVISQFHYASASAVSITTFIGFTLSTLEQDLKNLSAPTLTPEGKVTEKEKEIPWYQTHLRSAWYTNGLFIFQWIIPLGVQLPLLIISDHELEITLSVKYDQFFSPMAQNLYLFHLNKSEYYFRAYYILHSFMELFVFFLFCYYLVQQRNSDANRIYNRAPTIAYVIALMALTTSPVNILFAVDSHIFLVGTSPLSVRAAIAVVTLTSYTALSIMLIILYYSINLPDSPKVMEARRSQAWNSNLSDA